MFLDGEMDTECIDKIRRFQVIYVVRLRKVLDYACTVVPVHYYDGSVPYTSALHSLEKLTQLTVCTIELIEIELVSYLAALVCIVDGGR